VALSVAVSIALTVVPVSPILGGGRVGESVGDAISFEHLSKSFGRSVVCFVCVCVCVCACMSAEKAPGNYTGLTLGRRCTKNCIDCIC
jgi:hypothetical protein